MWQSPISFVVLLLIIMYRKHCITHGPRGSSCDSDGDMMMGSDCSDDGEGITIWWDEIT